MMNYLDNNLNALKSVNAILADMIEKSISKDYKFLDIKFIDNGFSNLFIKNNNKINSAYGVKNQLENIQKQADLLSLNGNSLSSDSGTVIIGMGIGHFAAALCERKEEKHIIIIVETFPFLLKAAFTLYDFSEYIKNGTFLIACPDQIEFQMVMGMVEYNCIIKEWNIISEMYTTLLPEFYSELTIYVSDLINQIRCNTGTVMANGKIIAQNDIKNLPYILSSHGIEEFKDIFKGKPAVIVSTGPSLRKNIHCLAQHKDKIVIISVAQALRILLSYDIVPDFACTVDFGEVNYEHFKGLMDCNIPLIVLNRCYHKILNEWQGPKIVATSPANPEIKNITNFLSTYGWVEQGGSVSHMALGSAIKMGCNPIILIGQDLAYEDNLSHNPNADASGKVTVSDDGLIKWNVDDPNSILKGQDCVMGTIQEIPGYVENTVKTNIGLLSFITSFETLFKRYEKDITFINSTEGGADIKGAKKIVLRDALKKYADKIVYKNNFRNILEKEVDVVERCLEAVKILNDDIKELQQITEYCTESLNSANNAIKFFNAKRKLRRYLDENTEYSNKAHELTKRNDLLSIAIYYASRSIYAKELSVEGSYEHISKNKKDFMIRVDRNKLIIKAAKDEAIELLKLYKLAISIINTIKEYYTFPGDDNYVLRNIVIEDGRLVGLNEELYEKEKVWYDLSKVEDYFKKENFSYPLLEANKALNYFREYKISDKDKINKVKDILQKAILMRKKVIDDAEKLFNESKIRDKLLVKDLIDQSIEYGKNAIKNKSDKKLMVESFDKALYLIKQAYKIMPDSEYAMWGLATIKFFLKRADEAIKWYKILIDKYPNNYQYQYEYGNVLMSLKDEPTEGINKILKVMEKTNKFDHFFRYIGKYYYLKNNFEKAAEYFREYTELFPADYEALKILADCYNQLKDNRFVEVSVRYAALTGENIENQFLKNGEKE